MIEMELKEIELELKEIELELKEIELELTPALISSKQRFLA